MTDAELVLASQRGDRGAFEELVRSTARLVYARIFLEVGNRHRTEDLVQETYLLAFKSIRQVTDTAGFRDWLMAVARTVTVDALRREGRKKRAARWVPEEMLNGIAGRDIEPGMAAGAREEREQVLAILRGMPEEYQGPLMLRYVVGADYQTIRRELGISDGALRGLLHRGMVMLRAEYEKLGRHAGKETTGLTTRNTKGTTG